MKCTNVMQLRWRQAAMSLSGLVSDRSGSALASALSGHTLVEVMVSLAVLGFMVISLYAGFSSGFAVVRVARENLRATQILAERMEVIRLIKWDDVVPGF